MKYRVDKYEDSKNRRNPADHPDSAKNPEERLAEAQEAALACIKAAGDRPPSRSKLLRALIATLRSSTDAMILGSLWLRDRDAQREKGLKPKELRRLEAALAKDLHTLNVLRGLQFRGVRGQVAAWLLLRNTADPWEFVDVEAYLGPNVANALRGLIAQEVLVLVRSKQLQALRMTSAQLSGCAAAYARAHYAGHDPPNTNGRSKKKYQCTSKLPPALALMFEDPTDKTRRQNASDVNLHSAMKIVSPASKLRSRPNRAAFSSTVRQQMRRAIKTYPDNQATEYGATVFEAIFAQGREAKRRIDRRCAQLLRGLFEELRNV